MRTTMMIRLPVPAVPSGARAALFRIHHCGQQRPLIQREKSLPLMRKNSSYDPIQEQMAKAMAAKMQNEDDECVICMEGFDPTNPRMPTHCGCGRNRTYFHLPCLYQWVEQSRDCPSCRERLIWEEF
jgi:hypothetical protein